MEKQKLTINEELGILALKWLFSLLGETDLEQSYLLNTFRELSDFQKTAIINTHHVMLRQIGSI